MVAEPFLKQRILYPSDYFYLWPINLDNKGRLVRPVILEQAQQFNRLLGKSKNFTDRLGFLAPFHEFRESHPLTPTLPVFLHVEQPGPPDYRKSPSTKPSELIGVTERYDPFLYVFVPSFSWCPFTHLNLYLKWCLTGTSTSGPLIQFR